MRFSRREESEFWVDFTIIISLGFLLRIPLTQNSPLFRNILAQILGFFSEFPPCFATPNNKGGGILSRNPSDSLGIFFDVFYKIHKIWDFPNYESGTVCNSVLRKPSPPYNPAETLFWPEDPRKPRRPASLAATHPKPEVIFQLKNHCRRSGGSGCTTPAELHTRPSMVFWNDPFTLFIKNNLRYFGAPNTPGIWDIPNLNLERSPSR